ncbi:MAG: hypothetical protein QGI13_16955 [Rhodospirillales bacterium]|jgi:hypothetical protein|nr:hypothetical protein [Rhodospirillales bacterium]
MHIRTILSRMSSFAATRAVVVVVAAFILLGFKPLEINPESARIAPELPLADLHFHPQSTISPTQARDWMDRNGVRWIGGGAKAWKMEVLALGRAMWTTYARDLGDRFIPIGGMTELNVAYRLGGIAAMEDADDPVIKDLLRHSAEDLKAGRIKAVGTVFINNSRSHTNPAFRRKADRVPSPSHPGLEGKNHRRSLHRAQARRPLPGGRGSVVETGRDGQPSLPADGPL